MSDVGAPGWRTSLIVQGLGPRHGNAVPVVVGLIETVAGGVQIALRVGRNGDPVFLPFQTASQLIVNVQEALAERFAITGNQLGGDEP